MRFPPLFLALIPFLLPLSASAAYEPWTNKEGVTVRMELISVSGEGDEIQGKFRMVNGATTTVKGSSLDEAGLEKLKAAQSAQAAKEAGPAFDPLLAKGLLKVEGGKLTPSSEAPRPAKYYVFYYTAKWCGPCQAFTPGLVNFYNKQKPGNANFEIITVSWDRSQSDLEEYAVQKKMPWFVLSLADAKAFSKKHNHDVSGIPDIVVTDLQGKVIKHTRDLRELGKLVK